MRCPNCGRPMKVGMAGELLDSVGELKHLKVSLSEIIAKCGSCARVVTDRYIESVRQDRTPPFPSSGDVEP